MGQQRLQHLNLASGNHLLVLFNFQARLKNCVACLYSFLSLAVSWVDLL
jgi:hypothetical protein